MNFGITKTIPAERGIEKVHALYDGSLQEYEFHMAGKPSKLQVGDYVYTIFQDQIRGRLKIKELRNYLLAIIHAIMNRRASYSIQDATDLVVDKHVSGGRFTMPPNFEEVFDIHPLF